MPAPPPPPGPCPLGPPSLEPSDSHKGESRSCLSFIILITGALPSGGLVNVEQLDWGEGHGVEGSRF